MRRWYLGIDAIPYARLLVLVTGAVPHAFAAHSIIKAWGSYRPPFVCVVALALSAAIPVLVASQMDRRPAPRTPDVFGIGLLVLVVDLGTILVTEPAARGTYAGWQASTLAINLLTLAIVMTSRQVVAITTVHVAITMWAAFSIPHAVPGRHMQVVLMMAGAVLTPIAGVLFVQTLLPRLAARRTFAEAALAVSADALAQSEAARVARERLDDLRRRVGPLLTSVATNGGVTPNQARLAAELSTAIRGEIISRRDRDLEKRITSGTSVVVDLADGLDLLETVDPIGHAQLDAIVKRMSRRLETGHIVVSVDSCPTGARCVVTAHGRSVGAVATDPVLRAVVSDAGGSVAHEPEGLTVVELILRFSAAGQLASR